MKKLALIAACLVVPAALASDSWTGKLVDASCKVSNEETGSFGTDCSATSATHLFAIELPDEKVLNLDAAGNGKAADAVKDGKTALRAKITGSLDGQIIKVETIEVQ